MQSINTIVECCAPVLEDPPQVEALPFFTDAAVLTPAFGDIPTLILGPGDTHMAHQTDEFCQADCIPIAVKLYQSIIQDWLTHNA